jgi:hypothetical protein
MGTTPVLWKSETQVNATDNMPLEHDPEKVGTGFRKRSCSTNRLEPDDDSKRNHHALATPGGGGYRPFGLIRARRLRGNGRGEQARDERGRWRGFVVCESDAGASAVSSAGI